MKLLKYFMNTKLNVFFITIFVIIIGVFISIFTINNKVEKRKIIYDLDSKTTNRIYQEYLNMRSNKVVFVNFDNILTNKANLIESFLDSSLKKKLLKMTNRYISIGDSIYIPVLFDIDVTYYNEKK